MVPRTQRTAPTLPLQSVPAAGPEPSEGRAALGCSRPSASWGAGGVRGPASEAKRGCVLRTVSGVRLRTAGSGRCRWACPRWPGAPLPGGSRPGSGPMGPQLTEGKMMERRKKIALELSELVVYCRPVPFDEERKGPAGGGRGFSPGASGWADSERAPCWAQRLAPNGPATATCRPSRRPRPRST